MSVEEILARTLPHQPWFRSAGGNGGYHAAEISFALAAIDNPLARDLLFSKATGTVDWEDLERRVVPHILFLAGTEVWAFKDMDAQRTCRQLARICISECLIPRACPFCRGVRTVWSDEALREVTCPRCLGLGTAQYSQRQNARVMGCSHVAWAKTWQPRYRRIMQSLEDSIAVAERQFCAALFGRAAKDS